MVNDSRTVSQIKMPQTGEGYLFCPSQSSQLREHLEQGFRRTNLLTLSFRPLLTGRGFSITSL
jgi:hypothetical protein